MHFGFNNQFIKVKRILAKISKTTNILFCLSLRTRGMTLHVMRIPNNNKPQHDFIFYQTLKQCSLP